MKPSIFHWRKLLQARFYSGNTLKLLHTGAEFFPELEQAIHLAQQEIHLETYIYANDITGKRIALALAAAAKRGVKVYLVVDGYGTPRLSPVLFDFLINAGVQIKTFRPETRSFRLSRQRLRRLHRKLAVIDQRLAFVGGINIMDDFLDPNHGLLTAPRLDFAVCVTGPVVVPIHLAMRRLWLMFNRKRERARQEWQHIVKKYWLKLTEPIEQQLQEGQRAAFVLRDNLRFRHAVEEVYLQAIKQAQKEIIIANAYFFPGENFCQALIQAAQRGVKVILLLQGKIEYRIQHYATQALYDELLTVGINLIEYDVSFLHAKVAVIDEYWATVGSSNIDPFSLLLAREANLVVQDSVFARQLHHALWHAIAQGGRPVSAQYHARRFWGIRLLHRLAYLVVRIGIALSGQAVRY